MRFGTLVSSVWLVGVVAGRAISVYPNIPTFVVYLAGLFVVVSLVWVYLKTK